MYVILPYPVLHNIPILAFLQIYKKNNYAMLIFYKKLKVTYVTFFLLPMLTIIALTSWSTCTKFL